MIAYCRYDFRTLVSTVSFTEKSSNQKTEGSILTQAAREENKKKERFHIRCFVVTVIMAHWELFINHRRKHISTSVLITNLQAGDGASTPAPTLTLHEQHTWKLCICVTRQTSAGCYTSPRPKVCVSAYSAGQISLAMNTLILTVIEVSQTPDVVSSSTWTIGTFH